MLLTIIAVLITGRTWAEDQCNCWRVGPGKYPYECNEACAKPAPKAVVDALKNRFPDARDDDVSMFLSDPPQVTFWRSAIHMACRIQIGPPIVIDRCHVIHA